MYPDFLVIGAQKAGTTWLYKHLGSHPEIWLPPEKEIHYFDNLKLNTENENVLYKRKGKLISMGKWLLYIRSKIIAKFSRFKRCMLRDFSNLSFRNLIWDMRLIFGRKSDEWYASLFEAGRGKKTGEITPAYSTVSENVVEYVYNIMPNAKVIFIMRNPIIRVWSQTRMDFIKKTNVFEKSNGHIEDVSINDFIRHFESSASTLRSNYIRTLTNWQLYFPKEQFFVAFMEDIVRRPRELLVDICTFLDVDSSLVNLDDSVERKVLDGYNYSMPDKVGSYLAQMYYAQIKQLAEMFCGDGFNYVQEWLCMADSLLENKQ